MIEEEEKKYKILKIEKIDKDIEDSKRTAALYAVLSGMYSIMTAGFGFEAFYYDNPVKLFVSGIIGACSIYKIISYGEVHKEIDKLKKIRDELIDDSKDIKGRDK